MERMKFSPEGGNGMSDICSDDGAVKVSTGIVRHSKRVAVRNRYKIRKLKIKRQQYSCCCCLIKQPFLPVGPRTG